MSNRRDFLAALATTTAAAIIVPLDLATRARAAAPEATRILGYTGKLTESKLRAMMDSLYDGDVVPKTLWMSTDGYRDFFEIASPERHYRIGGPQEDEEDEGVCLFSYDKATTKIERDVTLPAGTVRVE